MSETPGPEWALAGVVIGAIIGGGAQILANWLQWKRDEKRDRRARRAENLYKLQDQLTRTFEIAQNIVNDLQSPLKQPAAQLFWDDTELKNAIISLNSYSVRVGDDPLSKHIDKVLECLYRASQIDTKERGKLLRAAMNNLEGVQMRVGALLHTDTETEFGVEQPASRFESLAARLRRERHATKGVEPDKPKPEDKT